VSVGEYSYTETTTSTSTDANGAMSTSTSSNTYHFVVIVVMLATAFPPMSLAPRGALSKLGRAMFGDGSTATGDPRFDKVFRIRTTAPQAVPHVFRPQLIAETLAGGLGAWSLSGQQLLAYQPGRLADPALIPALAWPLVRVAGLLPR